MSAVDQQARDAADDAMNRIDKHEAVCAERYRNLETSLAAGSARMGRIDKGIEGIASILKWGGATLVTTLIAAIGGLIMMLRAAT